MSWRTPSPPLQRHLTSSAARKRHARAREAGGAHGNNAFRSERDVLMLHGGAQETVLRTQVAKPTGTWAPPRHPWEWCAEIGQAGSLFVDLATQTCCCLSLQELSQSCARGGGTQTPWQSSNPPGNAPVHVSEILFFCSSRTPRSSSNCSDLPRAAAEHPMLFVGPGSDAAVEPRTHENRAIRSRYEGAQG
jgi:hypothetical protein